MPDESYFKLLNAIKKAKVDSCDIVVNDGGWDIADPIDSKHNDGTVVYPCVPVDGDPEKIAQQILGKLDMYLFMSEDDNEKTTGNGTDVRRHRGSVAVSSMPRRG